MLVTFHVDAPPEGRVDVRMLPAASPATHSRTDGHETVVMAFCRSTSVTFHAAVPAVGSVEVKTFP
jgi:hypothetical protein